MSRFKEIHDILIRYKNSDSGFGNQELAELIVEIYNKAIDDVLRSAKLEKASNYGHFVDDPNPNFELVDTETLVKVIYGHGDCGYEAFRVAKGEIEKLKIK